MLAPLGNAIELSSRQQAGQLEIFKSGTSQRYMAGGVDRQAG